MSQTIKIGVVGYSGKPFDKAIAKEKLRSILESLIYEYDGQNIELVSGYTNIGVPKIAYEIADELGMHTVGFSAKEALNVDCGLYPVKKEIIVGEKFGDESEAFIKYIDVLIRIGGGTQSHSEVLLFKNINKDQNLEEILFEADL